MATYKQKMNAEVEKEKIAMKKAAAILLNGKKSKKERLKAAANAGTFLDDDEIEKAVTIFRDQKEDPDVKAAVILALTNYAAKNEWFLDQLIGILKDDDTPAPVKNAAISVLQANTFSSPLLASKKPAYKNALQTVVEKQGAGKLKRKAVEYLALDKDEYIQRKLIDGLENRDQEVVKPEVAIQLLSYDLHSDVYPTLKKIVANPPNLRAKKEALRNLSADPSSASLLQETLNNKKEDKEIRHVCAVGLQRLQPELLQNSLKGILTDKKENKELQVALLNTLNYTPDTQISDNDRHFQSNLESYIKKTSSKKLKNTYKMYINNKSRNNF